MSTIARFLSFAFAASDLLMEIDGQGRITFALGAARLLLGREETELVQLPIATLIDPRDRGMVRSLLASMSMGSRCGPILVRLAGPEVRGRPRCAMFSACALPELQGRIACTMASASASAMKEVEGRRRDVETELLDKGAFADVAADVVHGAGELGEILECSLIEAPGIEALAKQAPDAHRTLMGRIGDILRSHSVDGQTAGRLSPTRFGVVHRAGAADLSGTLMRAAMDSIGPHGRLEVAQRRLMADAGTMTRDDTVKALRFAVDRFASGTDLAEMPETIEDSLDELVQNTIGRMRDFKALVTRDGFELHYQPIVELGTGKLHHFEVLTRFERDHSPADMIQFAEDTGIIETFDLAVVNRAIELVRTRSAPLAVNLSGRSVTNPVFIKLLLEVLDANPGIGRNLGFEITESSRLTDLEAADRMIQDIRRRGFAVALDDLGAGAASFQYLQALTVDSVKIDGTYIRRIGESARDDTILRGMVRLCTDLGVAVIGEMIETREQADALRAMGGTYGQGWLFGRPMKDPVWKKPQ